MDLAANLRNKFLAYSALITSFTVFTQAQLGPGSNLPGTTISFQNIINTVLFWDLGSGAGFWLGLALFLATWGGFYFATRPLLLELYGVILDNFPTSDRRNRYSTTSDGEPIGMKGLAATSSFVAAQAVGQFFGFIIMVGIGGLGIFVFLYSYFKGTSSFRSNYAEALNGGDQETNVDPDDLNLDQQFQEMREELEDEFEREENIKQRISRLRGEKEDFNTAAEELIASGDLPENVQRDIEYLKEEMDDDLQKEHSLASILDEAAKEEETEIEELNNVEDLAEYVRSEFSHLVELENELDGKVNSIERELADLRERTQNEGINPEVREEFSDLEDKIDVAMAEVREAVGEAQDANQRATEAMNRLEEIQSQEEETKNEVEEAEREEEEIEEETADEEGEYETVKEELQQQTEALRQDRERYRQDMEEIHGAVKAEENIARLENEEVREEHDEMMKIDHEREELEQLIKQDNSKIAQVAQDLKQKTDELQEMKEETNELAGFAERAEMEEEEFNQALEQKIEEMEQITEDFLKKDEFDLLFSLETKLDEIVQLRRKMPPEIRNREEGRYLERQQGRIYSIFGDISQELERRKERNDLRDDAAYAISELNKEIEQTFPPLVEDNQEDIDLSRFVP